MNKKFSIVALFVAFCLLLATGCGGAKDLTKGKSPQEIVVASSSAMQDLKSYCFTMDMKMDFPNPLSGSLETLEMSGTGETTVNPLMAHMKVLTKVMGQESPMEIYVAMDADKLLEYLSNPMAPGEWMKIEMPMTPEMQEMANPVKSLEIMQEMLVDAKVLKEVEENNVQYVVIEATLKPDALTKFLPTGSPVDLRQMTDIFANIGNIQYITWIRKDNLYVTKTEMDLGDIMKRVLINQPGITAKEKALMDKISATMRMTYTDYNKVQEITIPEDVVKSAKKVY